MKRFLAAILTLVLLMQALPWTAFAAGSVGDMITDEELRRALQIAGMQMTSHGDGSAIAKGLEQVTVTAKDSGFREGMSPEKTWNAQLLSDWLGDELSGRIYSVTNVFIRADTLLEKFRTDEPEVYARLTDDSIYDAQFVDRCRQWVLDTESMIPYALRRFD